MESLSIPESVYPKDSPNKLFLLGRIFYLSLNLFAALKKTQREVFPPRYVPFHYFNN